MSKNNKGSNLFVLDGQEDEWDSVHWEDMPEFEQEDLDIYGSINIAFRTEEDFRKFANLIEQPSISRKSRGQYDNKTHRKLKLDTWSEFTALLYNLSKQPKKGKKDAELISPAVYKTGTTRANKNVLSWASWAAIDVDDHVFEGNLENALAETFMIMLCIALLQVRTYILSLESYSILKQRLKNLELGTSGMLSIPSLTQLEMHRLKTCLVCIIYQLTTLTLTISFSLIMVILLMLMH